MKIPILRDRHGLIMLANCTIRDTDILCGFAAFAAGLSGELELSAEGDHSIWIVVPEMSQSINCNLFASERNDISIKRVEKNETTLCP